MLQLSAAARPERLGAARRPTQMLFLRHIAELQALALLIAALEGFRRS